VPDRWVNPQGWGPQPPNQPPTQPPSGPNPPPQPGRPPEWGPPNPNPMWRRKAFWIAVAASVGVLVLIAVLLPHPDTTSQQAQAPLPTVEATSATATLPTTATSPPTTAPPTTIPKVAVPRLVGMKLARAKRVLADRGLHASITYKTTAQSPAGTVLSQSRKVGTSVAPGGAVTLVVAKAPPPPPPTAPPPTAPPSNCDPAYPDACLHDGIGDYDCAGGSGNGPNYVEGPITVLAPDPFDLDRDGDGVGCEEAERMANRVKLLGCRIAGMRPGQDGGAHRLRARPGQGSRVAH